MQATQVAPLAVGSASPMHHGLARSRMAADLPVQGTGKTFGICACHSGAGATTIAQNLAVMLHERGGEPVVLVEANMRTPSLAARRHIESGRGFSDFALGDELMSTVVADAVQQGVWLMPASDESAPLPLLREASARLPALREKFRHILVDLPPVLDFPDATLMGATLDGVVLVIEAEGTQWDAARQAKKRLEAGGVKLLGVVLNKKREIVPEWVRRRL